MGAYILRRLLLVIPTLFGIMLVNFGLTQLVPGGPLDQIEAQLQGEGDAIAAVTGGGGGDAGSQAGAASGMRPISNGCAAGSRTQRSVAASRMVEWT